MKSTIKSKGDRLNWDYIHEYKPIPLKEAVASRKKVNPPKNSKDLLIP